MRHALVATLFAFVLAVPAAADLDKYKNWDQSPEAYFLTAAEREEWSRVTSDAAAEAFVARYYARRGNDFMEELTVRIQKADQYLSVGKTKGSRTLRGKLAIIFGPPASLVREAKARRGADRSAAITPLTDGGGDARNQGAGMTLSDATQAATNVSAMRGAAAVVTVDTMTWSGDRLPKPLTEPVVVRVEIDSQGREKIQGSKEELAKLDQLIESVARQSIGSSN